MLEGLRSLPIPTRRQSISEDVSLRKSGSASTTSSKTNRPHPSLLRSSSFEKFANIHKDKFEEFALKYVSVSVILCGLAAEGNLPQLQALCDTGDYDVNVGDYDGRTALHLAAEEGHIECVKYLVEKGANVNAMDRWASTPLRGATVYQHHNIVQFLKEHGAVLRGSISSKADTTAALIEEEGIDSLQSLFTKGAPSTPRRGVDEENMSLQDIERSVIEDLLARRGIRAKKHQVASEIINAMDVDGFITWKNFKTTMKYNHDNVVQRALSGGLVIPDWPQFTEEVTRIIEEVKEVCRGKGHNAQFIKELASADCDDLGLAIMTVDGQKFVYGDSSKEFPLFTCGLPLLYSFVVEDIGEDNVHHWVGREPSGQGESSFELNEQKRPHNPLNTAGGLVTCALFRPKQPISQRFRDLQSRVSQLAGGSKIGFSQTVYLSEKDNSYRNSAIANFMRAENSFPEGTNIGTSVDFLYQVCGLEVTCSKMATVAATFANNGLSPLTGRKVLSPGTVKSTLQVMYSCGMHDYSGEWACTIGLPAKSAASGCVFMVIPGIMGVCVWSPPLDKNNNSYAGIEFFKRLTNRFKWSVFDVLFTKQFHDTV